MSATAPAAGRPRAGAPSRRPVPTAPTGPARRPTPGPAPAAAPRRAPRAPFIGLVLTLLTLGLGALLLLNTLLAQGSFQLHALDASIADLTDREQALRQSVAELAAPQRLARRAQAIGMVPVENPAFLRVEDGKVLGEPTVALGTPAPAPDTSGAPTAVSGGTPTEQQNDKQQNDKQQNDKQQNDKQQQGQQQGGNG